MSVVLSGVEFLFIRLHHTWATNPYLFICIYIFFLSFFVYYFYLQFFVFVLVQNWTLAWTNPGFGHILLFS